MMNLCVCHGGSQFRFTQRDLLTEGWAELRRFPQFNTLKIYLGRLSAEKYKLPWVDTSIMKLVDIARLQPYQAIFSETRSQFSTIIIVCNSTHQANVNYFNQQFTEDDAKCEEDEFHELATYLRTFPDKTFVLQNLEANNYDANTPIAFENMSRWANQRQAGVDRARLVPDNLGARDNVFHAIEINRKFKGAEIIRHVVPQLHVDLISYSCYQSQAKEDFQSSVDLILNTLNRTRIYCQGVPACVSSRFPVSVYIGDLFLDASELPVKQKPDITSEEFISMVLQSIVAYAQQKRIPIVNVWNLYDNQAGKQYGLINSERNVTPAGTLFLSEKK